MAPSTRTRNDCIASTHRFRIVFSRLHENNDKQLETVKTSGNLWFACQGNLNNLSSLLYRFQKFAFSVKTIRLHDNDIIRTISFSNVSTLEIVMNSYRFR